MGQTTSRFTIESNSPTESHSGPVDSGIWAGNRLLFGPHFILQYPIVRPLNHYSPQVLTTLGLGRTANSSTDPTNRMNLHSLTVSGIPLSVLEMTRDMQAGRMTELSQVSSESNPPMEVFTSLVNIYRSSVQFSSLPTLGAETPDIVQSNLTFSLDAQVPCVVHIHLLVCESEGHQLQSLAPDICSNPFISIPMPAGCGQTFDLSKHLSTGVPTANIASRYGDLISKTSHTPSFSGHQSTSPHNHVHGRAHSYKQRHSAKKENISPPMYPIVIIVEGNSNGNSTEPAVSREQWTILAIDPRDLKPHVIKQKVWLGDQGYLVQDIYGLTNDSVSEEEQEQQPECSICLTNLKDTLILPCRHVCLCSLCANQLRVQNSKCPICRQDFHTVLHLPQVKSCVDGSDMVSSHVVPVT